MQRSIKNNFIAYTKACKSLKQGTNFMWHNVRCLATVKELFPHKSSFPARHIGPRKTDVVSMLDLLGFKSLDELSDKAVPSQIHLKRELNIEDPLSKLFCWKQTESIEKSVNYNNELDLITTSNSTIL